MQTCGCHCSWLSVRTQVKLQSALHRWKSTCFRRLEKRYYYIHFKLLKQKKRRKNPKLPLAIYYICENKNLSCFKSLCLVMHIYWSWKEYLVWQACLVQAIPSAVCLMWSTLKFITGLQEKDPREVALSQCLKAVDLEIPSTTVLVFVCWDIDFWV